MTRQSKNATRLAQARKRSAERKNGNKGPDKTAPSHGKRRENCQWYQKKMGIDPKKRGGRARVAVEEDADVPVLVAA